MLGSFTTAIIGRLWWETAVNTLAYIVGTNPVLKKAERYRVEEG